MTLDQLREAVRINTCGWHTVQAACAWFNRTYDASTSVDRDARSSVFTVSLGALPRPWDVQGNASEIVGWFIND